MLDISTTWCYLSFTLYREEMMRTFQVAYIVTVEAEDMEEAQLQAEEIFLDNDMLMFSVDVEEITET